MITITAITIQHEPHTETRAVGLYVQHTRATYTYTRDFSRKRKEVSRSREKSEGFTTPPLKVSTSLPRSRYLGLLDPLLFYIFRSPRRTARGKSIRGSPAFIPISFLHILFISFHFLPFLDLLLICTFLGNFLSGGLIFFQFYFYHTLFLPFFTCVCI